MTGEAGSGGRQTPSEPFASNAAAVLDEHGQITAWNDAASGLLGYKLEDVLGRPATSLLARDLPRDVGQRIADKREWSALAVLRHRSGREAPCRLSGFPLTAARRSIKWLVQAGELASGAPERRDAQSRATVFKEWSWDRLTIPVAVCDGELRLIAVNRGMVELAGTDEDRLLTRSFEDIAPSESEPLEGVARLAAEVLQSGETKRHTTRTPGGTEAEERIWSVVLSPLADSEGSVQALSVAFVETTQQAQSRRRLAVVNDAGSRIGRTLDVAETAQEMADVSTAFADFITVDLLDAVLDGGEVDPDLPVGRPLMFRRVAQQSVQTGCPESVIPLGEAHAHSEDSPAGRALRSGQPYRHGLDAPEVRRWLREFPARAQAAREHGIHSVMGVPLVARGTTLGIAQFFRHRTRPRFDADDLLLAQEIAARASVCVDNARRYARERAAAVALQHSLLPHFTRTHAALDTASRYLPAAERVGGAWFDVIPLSGARVALVVGDVVGHGIPAAATMGRLSTAVRTLADMELPPEELLTHLDDLVVTLTREHARRRRQSPSGDLGSTCLYAIYDPIACTCTMASAGHPPPALVTPDGVVEFVEVPPGPALGVGGLPFETVTLQVPQESLLVSYTNGVIQVTHGDIEVGKGVLRDTLHRHTGSLEQTCDSIIASILQGRPSDDVALLIARTRSLDSSQTAQWGLSSDPAAVREARRQVGLRLADWGLDELAFTTELIVSELVTNAIRYGGEPQNLRLIRDTSLTCEVADSGGAAPRVRRARMLDEGGRGLLVVQQLADRWGSRHTDEGKIIWAEQFLLGC